MKNVAVTYEQNGTMGVLAWFDTVPEAEHFIAICEWADPIGVHAGYYGIDVGCMEEVA